MHPHPWIALKYLLLTDVTCWWRARGAFPVLYRTYRASGLNPFWAMVEMLGGFERCT